MTSQTSIKCILLRVKLTVPLQHQEVIIEEGIGNELDACDSSNLRHEITSLSWLNWKVYYILGPSSITCLSIFVLSLYILLSLLHHAPILYPGLSWVGLGLAGLGLSFQLRLSCRHALASKAELRPCWDYVGEWDYRSKRKVKWGWWGTTRNCEAM